MNVVKEGWLLVRLPEHQNVKLVTSYPSSGDAERGLHRNRLACRRYIEQQIAYSTWVVEATGEVVYAADEDAHIAFMRERELLGTHQLIGLGRYALRHFSYLALGR